MPEMTKEQRKERVQKRIGSADTSNHTYFPAKENDQYVKTDAFQLVGIYARVSTDNPAQTSSFELQQKYYVDMPDPVTSHWPHWVPLSEDAESKWYISAKKNAEKSNMLL